LRTTAVSLMFSINQPITVVSKVAGHKNPSTTLKHYAELLTSDLQIAVQELESAFLKQHVLKKFPDNSEFNPELVSSKNVVALNSGNESGPCRDRTDDPQIKSLTHGDDSMDE